MAFRWAATGRAFPVPNGRLDRGKRAGLASCRPPTHKAPVSRALRGIPGAGAAAQLLPLQHCKVAQWNTAMRRFSVVLLGEPDGTPSPDKDVAAVRALAVRNPIPPTPCRTACYLI